MLGVNAVEAGEGPIHGAHTWRTRSILEVSLVEELWVGGGVELSREVSTCHIGHPQIPAPRGRHLPVVIVSGHLHNRADQFR
jgi:hypothetical protein